MQRVADRADDRDKGAVAIMFALMLVVLIGFIGLAIDVGSAYAKTQEVQNAADAGALAVAQECAGADPACEASAQRSLAGDYAGYNIRTGYDPATLPDVTFPSDDRVTVTVTAENENFFVGLFGFDAFTVKREATAAWGRPTQLQTFLPLTIGECEYSQLLLESSQVVTVNLTKTSNLNCGTPTSGNVMPGGFGYIGSGACADVIIDINEDDGWVGLRTGSNPPDCDTATLENIVNNRTPILVPIFDKCRMSPNPHPEENRCLVAADTDAPKNGYHITGFAAIELHGFKFSGTGQEKTYPKSGADNINTHCPGEARCIRGKFVEWVGLQDVAEWGTTPDYGVDTVRLIDPDYVAAGS